MTIKVLPFSKKPGTTPTINYTDDAAQHTFTFQEEGYFTGFVVNRSSTNIIDATLISKGTSQAMPVYPGTGLHLKNQKMSGIQIQIDPANSTATGVQYDIQGKVHVPETKAEEMSLEADSEYFFRLIAPPSIVSGNWSVKVDSSGNLGLFYSGTEVLAFGSAGTISQYDSIATAGLGVAPILGVGLRVSLGTSATQVATYTPTGNQNFRVSWNLSCKTSSTPDLQLTYTDPDAGAQTITLYNSAMTAGGVQSGFVDIVASSASAVTVAGTDSVALGDIFATATIERLQ